MKQFLLIMIFLIISCKNEEKKISISSEKVNKEKIQDSLYSFLDGVYGYKGLYSKFSMVDCPDYVEFTRQGLYFGYNDCGMSSATDTIAEKGKYYINNEENKLIFFERKFYRKEYFENSNEDSLILNIKSIRGDTIIINKNGINVYYLRAAPSYD
ncbi:hypothetical protein [Thalassobellus citreus]|uniref:hypothetical protein n=1 Tax=Thalassobellus citreus TaxID=3367752 RepID=UPI0037B2B735